MSYWVEEAVIALCESPECRVPLRPSGTSEEDLWRELVTCMLGSQVPNWMGVAATRLLERHGLVGPADRPCTVEAVASVLRVPLESPHGLRRYRFPNVRARDIVSAHRAVCQLHGSLQSLVYECSPDECRRRLIHSVSGIGLKQASLFIRNVGISTDFAILDTHVVRYMREIGLVRALPRSISPDMYYVLESVLSRYAQQLGQPVGHVDRAIWAVMSISTGTSL
jgi:N-glycosylase/DNA lyase